MHNNSATSLLGQIFKPILSVHMLFRKVTILILKTGVIHWEEFTKHLAFYLLNEIAKGITIDETTFFRIMTM